jgi:hypothetical protein
MFHVVSWLKTKKGRKKRDTIVHVFSPLTRILSLSLSLSPYLSLVSAVVFPVFTDPRAVDIVIGRMYEAISRKHVDIDAIVGLDARGFLFGPLLAQRLNCAFVPVRKVGKVSW